MTPRTVRLCGQTVENPGHVCAFFSSRDEEYDTLIPYVRDGIESDEHVVNVLDQSRLADHRARLVSGGVAEADGHLSLSSSEDTYLADGSFDMQRMIDFVSDHLTAAAGEGRQVRTAGWMD